MNPRCALVLALTAAVLLLLPTAAAERVTLRDGDTALTVDYDLVFETDEIYYLDFTVANGSGYRVEVELPDTAPRHRDLPGNGTASLSFPGATYREARYNQPLEVRLLRDGEVRANATVEFNVHVPPAGDLAHLWGAMTLLWAGVAGYVAWLHILQRRLSVRLAQMASLTCDDDA